MNKFNITPEFAEELGAYLEGNLSMEDNFRIKELISIDEDLSALVDEVSHETMSFSSESSSYPHTMDFNMFDNFCIPEIVYMPIDSFIKHDDILDTHCAMLDESYNHVINGTIIDTTTSDYTSDEQQLITTNNDDLINI